MGSRAFHDLESVIESTVAEGCVGETLSAAEAEEARDAAVPAVVKNALRRVASDEAAHAALAFRFVSWAVAVGGPSARETARSAFAREIERRRAEPVLEAVRESLLREHGLLPASERRALRLAARPPSSSQRLVICSAENLNGSSFARQKRP